MEAVIFFAGDVMTGRGIDQILPTPSTPVLYEPHVQDARDYVRMAEDASGSIPHPVPCSYPWGAALDDLERARPDARIVNLETSITVSGDAWPDKDVHYRMHPANVPCLVAAKLDVCVLANNHVIDWGRAGLVSTLETLRSAGMRTAGAGKDLDEARAPCVAPLARGGNVVVLGVGSTSSGIPRAWAASKGRPGVALIGDTSETTAQRVASEALRAKRSGDVVVVSIHWGSNWGYDVPERHVAFAHALIERGVDVVHGHSSHHPLPIEIFRQKLILYGCGDLITDYEGISGYERYRGDLGLLYFAKVQRETGVLLGLQMLPTRMRKLRLERPDLADAQWLTNKLDTISRPHGSRIDLTADGSLMLSSA